MRIAEAVISEAEFSEIRKKNIPEISYSAKEGMISVKYSSDPSKSKLISPYDL